MGDSMRTVFFVFVGVDEASRTVQALFSVLWNGDALKHRRAYTGVILAPVPPLVPSIAAIRRGKARRRCGGSGVVLNYERGAEGIPGHV